MNALLLDLPEAIETPRLRLVMPRAGYGEKVHEAIVDGYDDLVYWLSWPTTPPTVQAVEEDCRRHHAAFITREFIRYLVIEKDSDQVIGRFGFPDFQAKWAIPQFGISYFVRKSQQGRGYATEATHALTQLAFQVMGAKKVEIYCDSENIKSQKVPERLGFQHECSFTGGWPRKDGALATLHLYAMFSADRL